MRHRRVGSDLRLDETGEGVDRLNCSQPGGDRQAKDDRLQHSEARKVDRVTFLGGVR
jgi:hypothetical protein